MVPPYWKVHFLLQRQDITLMSSLQNYFPHRDWFLYLVLSQGNWPLELMLLNCQHGPSDCFLPSQFTLSQTGPKISSGAKTTGGIIFTGSLDTTTLSWRARECNTTNVSTWHQLAPTLRNRSLLDLVWRQEHPGKPWKLFLTASGSHPSGEKKLSTSRPTIIWEKLHFIFFEDS